jgi:hypothetical protein
LVSPIKQYAPLDLTDLNRIVNLGDPVDAQDAATKSYVDTETYQDPLQAPGDIVWNSPLGSQVLYTKLGEFTGINYITDRVTGLIPGHTIRVTWEGRSGYSGGTDYVRTFQTGGSAVIRTVAGPERDAVWRAFSLDIVLAANETEIQMWADQAWSDPTTAFHRDIRFTDLNATSPARLSIGSEGSALRVSSGAPIWQPEVGALEIGIDGHGAVPQTGVRADLVIPYDLTITDWSIIADQSGSMQLDIWKSTLANYPPVDGGSITGSAPPALSNALTAASAALTGWSPALVKGDCLRINLDSVSTLTRATITLAFTKFTKT